MAHEADKDNSETCGCTICTGLPQLCDCSECQAARNEAFTIDEEVSE